MISESNIAASVKYGKYVGRRDLIGLYALLITAMLIPIVTIAVVISSREGLMVLESKIVITLILINTFALFLICVAVSLLLYHKRNIKEVQKWKQDAVVLKASVYRLDLLSPVYAPYQIAVRFYINGVKKEQTQRPNKFLGYHKMLVKYVGKQISIAYSPKYDQVIILRKGGAEIDDRI